MKPPPTKTLFSERKFLGFPLLRQHKKCSEILREVYLSHSQVLLDHYNEIQKWMNGKSIPSMDIEEIANRYHEHLQLSKQSLSEHNLLPQVRQKDRKSPLCKPLPVVIYLDRIRSAHNVGSILRTIEAFSLGEARFSPETPYIDNTQVKKTSMGSYKHVTCTQQQRIAELPRPWIILETCDQSIPLNDFLFPDSFTLVVGNEESGCSQQLLKEAEHIIEIPLRGRKNSLNVANALAIAAAEIVRQEEIKSRKQNGNQ